MLTSNPPAGRGCGTRKKGGTYLCCGTSPYGQPIEHFVKDPGWVWEYELSRAPTVLPDPQGIFHVYLLIGEGAYASPWFHIMETARFGLSRLVSPNAIDFSLLTPYASTIRCIYPRAIPNFDWEGNGDFSWYPECKVKTRWDQLQREGDLRDPVEDWEVCRLGNHPTDNPEHRPCTFTHRDVSYFLASKNQVEVDESNEFTISFPSIENTSFEYSGDVPFVAEDPRGRQNWKPGVLLVVPLTHIEMPYEANEHAEAIQNESDFDVFVTPF